MSVQLVVFDMAGTTVEDSGLVQQAFLMADDHAGLSGTPAERDDMLRYVTETMGQSKIEVFRHLSGGNEEQAQAANKAFEAGYAGLVAQGRCSEIPGATTVIANLRGRGIKAALTTGFAHETQQAIIDTLGWNEVADIVLCPGDGLRGRPYPDMPLAALIRTGTDSVREMVVVGDTASDVLSGVRAGALAVVGVRTGAHHDDQLRAAGATHVIDSVADLPALLDTLG
ncbi:haloacid dehalogenase [Mycobacterium sp. GA-1841]|uniref:phosphonatase-like hydrolase n=1 Tax=Mycobacterium sp. GA-1841 TaxID=1834154 RepID=UPI00096E427D|nr:phosphonatase-like hydrolase [Mycobacterium sp. GA-1841]OMC38107.1 haloacid dehalogenase [Mycobacterium sp. GA-1841]